MEAAADRLALVVKPGPCPRPPAGTPSITAQPARPGEPARQGLLTSEEFAAAETKLRGVRRSARGRANGLPGQAPRSAASARSAWALIRSSLRTTSRIRRSWPITKVTRFVGASENPRFTPNRSRMAPSGSDSSG